MIAPNDQYQPFWIWPAVLGGIAAIVALLWLLNRVLMRFFPNTGKYYHAGGNALMRVDAMLLPDRKHIIEASRVPHLSCSLRKVGDWESRAKVV